jgi:hypothetical protein
MANDVLSVRGSHRDDQAALYHTIGPSFTSTLPHICQKLHQTIGECSAALTSAHEPAHRRVVALESSRLKRCWKVYALTSAALGRASTVFAHDEAVLRDAHAVMERVLLLWDDLQAHFPAMWQGGSDGLGLVLSTLIAFTDSCNQHIHWIALGDRVATDLQSLLARACVDAAALTQIIDVAELVVQWAERVAQYHYQLGSLWHRSSNLLVGLLSAPHMPSHLVSLVFSTLQHAPLPKQVRARARKMHIHTRRGAPCEAG